MASEPEHIPVVVRTADFRGDHAADIYIVVMVPKNATVMDLIEIAKAYSRYYRAVVEVKEPDPTPRGDPAGAQPTKEDTNGK